MRGVMPGSGSLMPAASPTSSLRPSRCIRLCAGPDTSIAVAGTLQSLLLTSPARVPHGTCRSIREDVAWRGAAPAPGMVDRRVEITVSAATVTLCGVKSCVPASEVKGGRHPRPAPWQGPVDRKMVINALNSGASTFMADFEGGQGAPGACAAARHVMLGSGPPHACACFHTCLAVL